MRNLGMFGAVSIVAMLMTACSSVPREQVELYTETFADAEAAGNLVYDEISPIVARQLITDPAADSLKVAPAAGPAVSSNGASSDIDDAAQNADLCAADLGPLPFETCFDPDAMTAGTLPGEPIEIKARRRAMATVTLYNTLLVRLISGTTGEELGGEVRRLSSNLGGLLQFANAAVGPVAGLAGDTITRLLALQERFRADQELRTALVEGEPAIQELIAALINETSNLYEVKLRSTLEELNPLRTRINATRVGIRSLVREHAAPGDGRLLELSERLERAFGEVGIPPTPLPPLAGEQAAEPFSAIIDQRLTRDIEMVEQLTVQYMEKAATLNAFHAALGAYVAMLRDASTSLAILADTAAAPPAFTIDTSEIARQVAGIRNNANEIQQLLQNV